VTYGYKMYRRDKVDIKIRKEGVLLDFIMRGIEDGKCGTRISGEYPIRECEMSKLKEDIREIKEDVGEELFGILMRDVVGEIVKNKANLGDETELKDVYETTGEWLTGLRYYGEVRGEIFSSLIKGIGGEYSYETEWESDLGIYVKRDKGSSMERRISEYLEEDVDDDVVYYTTIIYSLINKEIFTEDYIRDARESILFGRTIFEDLMNYNSSLLHSTSYPYISILVERFIKEFESRVDFVVSKGDIEGEVFKRT